MTMLPTGTAVPCNDSWTLIIARAITSSFLAAMTSAGCSEFRCSTAQNRIDRLREREKCGSRGMQASDDAEASAETSMQHIQSALSLHKQLPQTTAQIQACSRPAVDSRHNHLEHGTALPGLIWGQHGVGHRTGAAAAAAPGSGSGSSSTRAGTAAGTLAITWFWGRCLCCCHARLVHCQACEPAG